MSTRGIGRKLRYGGVTAALTAAVIVIVIIINVIFTTIAHKKLWYTDLTPDLEFTLTDTCISYMKHGDPTFEESTSPIAKIDDFREELRKNNTEGLTEEEIKDRTMIEIIFCDEELVWTTDDLALKYVWKTAADLAAEFPDHIRIKFVDIIRNPTAVTKYGTGISESSVIITQGDEYRVRSLKSFYYMDGEEVVAYNGEKVYVSAFMAVTRATSPMVCFTMNHGETASANLSETFVILLENAGYEPLWIDLTKDEIPDECRLLVIFEPTEDFLVADGVSDIDELQIIDDFLDEDNSLMVFMSNTITQPLYNLEEYLEEWGIVFDRHQEGDMYYPYTIQDKSQSYDLNAEDDRADYGYNIKANYVNYGLGNDITSELSAAGKKIVFPSAMSISYADNVVISGYTETDGGDVLGDYGVLSEDGTTREIYDLFVSSDKAVALANGLERESAKNGNLFKLMTISVQDRIVSEDNYGIASVDEASYVVACACPQFASETVLKGQYGNSSFLNYTLRKIGHEPVPVGLEFRWFGDYTIDTVTTKQARTYMWVFTLVPAVLALGTGITVIVRRKNR